MTTVDFITELFCGVDDKLKDSVPSCVGEKEGGVGEGSRGQIGLKVS